MEPHLSSRQTHAAASSRRGLRRRFARRPVSSLGSEDSIPRNMKITRDIHDLIGGLLMVAAGLFFALYGSRYNFGSASRMGPGYFPVVLGWTLAVLGLLVALPAWWRRGAAVTVQWGNLGWTIASLLVFAWTLPRVGVVVASALAALLALVPSVMSLRTRLIVCAVVAVLTTLIFPLALQMSLPIWPWVAAEPITLAYCFFGVLLGTIVGVLPGIGALAAISLLLPLTYHMPPTAAIIMLAGVYYGSQYGGSTASILLNLPGTPSSAVTCLDGYPMTKKGKAGVALFVTTI
eukprot:gene41858-55523_t